MNLHDGVPDLQQQAEHRHLLGARKNRIQGRALAMESNGGAERGRIGSGNDNGRLKGGAEIRITDVMKADSARRSGLYMETDATLAGTLTNLVTGMI